MKKLFFPIFVLICFVGCQPNEKDSMIQSFDELYADVLAQNFAQVVDRLDTPSREFYEKITDPKNLNIDSILVIGTKNNLKYLTTEFLAFKGDEIKQTGKKTDFFDYLGSRDVSFFSFLKAYYVEKPKSKVGKEYFVSILRDNLASTNRGWMKFNKDANGEFKLDLLYTLKIHEQSYKKIFKQLRIDNPNKTPDEVLRHFYWQNSGANSKEFEDKQSKIKQQQLEVRSLQVDSYRAQGKIK